MKTYFLLLSLFLMLACNTNSSNEEGEHKDEDIVLTKEEQIIKTYNDAVLPLFRGYTSVDIPTEFVIDENDLGVNAGAAFGYVEISQGLVNLPKVNVQIFALSHEVAHIVTIPQAKIFDLEGSVPKGIKTNDYKKAEYLADLIAIYLIKTNEPKRFDTLFLNFPYLQNLFGNGTFTHPSGLERIEALNNFLEKAKLQGDDKAFKTSFIGIWQMD
ncbi:hypothetical protein [Algibacter lectus]|uniref:hypothetical protein n=1 Tax=Algibacter lectus TaxID=221126 RepID=UPI0026ECD675|nr:hypothetical protein [Algibacter lectus]MDO7138275.1 hypothetical protein [Algibacter lectus]